MSAIELYAIFAPLVVATLAMGVVWWWVGR
jgi:hypothetical protein